MLLDEPFNKLDEELRSTMRGFVFTHLQACGIPCLMVTHDRADAPAGGRVLRLEKGEVRDV
jgi:putative thiamine transport system ATP-binding protein